MKIKEWVDKQYEDGRVTQISDKELAELANREMEKYLNSIGEEWFERGNYL